MMFPERILTKQEYIAYSRRGMFGNRLREWGSLEELRDSGYLGNVTLRYAGGGAKFVSYGVPQHDIGPTVAHWVAKGADPRLVWANESAPDEKLLLQGEIARGLYGFTGWFTRERLPMRKALERGFLTDGLATLTPLRECLWPASYNDLFDLFDVWPDAVVEFSTFDIAVGNLPMRNTVI